MDENVHAGWNYHKWDEGEEPRYRYYRFFGTQRKGCVMNEIAFTGVETIDSNDETFTCPAKLVLGESVTDLNTVEYQGALTPALTAVSPRYGTVVGGTEITFTGTSFSDDTTKYTITLDGINCPVSAATTTSVTCTTGSRPGLRETVTEIYIDGQGLVSN